MIFIPMVVILFLVAVVDLVIKYTPGEGWYDSCWNANKTTDTLLVCKGMLENYCFNATVTRDLERCAKAGYYPNGTVTHVWERSARLLE